MPYPVSATPFPAGSANPNPAYANRFLPTVWSKRLGERLYLNTFLSRVTTMGWSDDLVQKGQTINVRFPPQITIRPYEANQQVVVERPSTGVQAISVNDGRYFYTLVDDVLLTQNDLELLDIWAEGASRDTKVALEAAFVPTMLTDIDVGNKGTTAGVKSLDVNLGTSGAPIPVSTYPAGAETNPVEFLARLAQVLDEQGVPATERFALVPPWFARALEATPAVIGASQGGWEAGLVGRVARFDVYSTVHIPAVGSASPILAGHRNGTGFVSALSVLEVLKRTDTFGTGLRGLQVSGIKAINNKMLALGYVGKAAGAASASGAALGSDLVPVTPSNTGTLPPNMGFRVRLAGDVNATFVGSSTIRAVGTLVVGEVIPVEVKQINTGTTATVDLILA
jgi:hypothetical protein